MPEDSTVLITREEAARRLGISKITAVRMSLDGRLPVVRIGPHCVRVDPRALDAWIVAHTSAVAEVQ